MSDERSRAGNASKTAQVLEAFHEEQVLGKAYDMLLLRRLWPFLAPRAGLVYSSLAVGVVTAGAALAVPVLMGKIIDEGALARDIDALTRYASMLVGLVLFERVLGFVQMYVVQVAGAEAVASLRRKVFEFLHGLPLRFFDQQPVGRLVTKVTNDTDAILELFASGALNAFSDLLKLVGIVAMMVVIDWKLALVAFAAGPPIAVLVAMVRSKARKAFREIRSKTSRMNANMAEQVGGMTTVQAFGRQDAAAGEFDDINAAYRDAIIRSIKYDAIQDAAIDMMAAMCLAFMVMTVKYHEASYGTLVMFNGYVVRFFEPISALAQRYTLLQSAMAGAERVFGLLDVAERDAAPERAEEQGDASLAVAFEGVTFGYKPNQPVLRDVSFEVRPGEKIALVGATGAGKTTVASLLLRLYPVTQGVIRLFGQDVRSLSREQLRSRFAVVPQDVTLFPGTVATNIAASLRPDTAKVRRVLEQLEALALFEQREGGLQAEVDERGENFSAGERQLIAFARAMYREADLVVLDEATASVDSDTESRLQRASDTLLRGRTALIIAHRLSTIQAADRILCFHLGRLVEAGTHQELLAKGGLYARLHGLHFQSNGARSNASEGSASREEPASLPR